MADSKAYIERETIMDDTKKYELLKTTLEELLDKYENSGGEITYVKRNAWAKQNHVKQYEDVCRVLEAHGEGNNKASMDVIYKGHVITLRHHAGTHGRLRGEMSHGTPPAIRATLHPSNKALNLDLIRKNMD